MLLRHHPLMSYQGLPTWPPVWVWTEGVEKKDAQGVVGVLKAAEQANIRPVNRCFLHIDSRRIILYRLSSEQGEKRGLQDA